MNHLHHLRKQDHIMHLSVMARGETKVSRKATANFSPQSLFVEVLQEEMRRQVVIKQIYIAGKPQLRDEIPAFMLAKDAVISANEGRYPIVRQSSPFEPLLDPIACGDEIVVELYAPDGGADIMSAGARTYVSIVLSGHLDFDAYLKRLAETGTHVRRTLLSIGEREDTALGRTTVVSKNSDGTTSIVMQEHPLEILKPEWFAVSPECAPFYEIIDLKIGTAAFFGGPMPIAASMFPPLPSMTDLGLEMFKKHLRLDMRVVTPGVIVTLAVRTLKERVGLHRPPFRAALHGITIEP